MTMVQVHLPDADYDIHIGSGILETALSRLVQDFEPQRFAVVADDTVADLYGARVCQALGGNAHVPLISFVAGEGSKSFSTLEVVTRQVLQAGLGRRDVLVALGGGVTGDLTGFVAAIARRGMRVVQVPTTLLAQVDSSVGGKTGINTPEGKNLVGAFYQPQRVIIDTATLSTLPQRHLRAGFAEVIKYGVIWDRSFFERLERDGLRILETDQGLEHVVARSCEIKRDVVEKDERESHLRMILNYGHTFGHAYEALMGYSETLLHGEAVALGMAQAARFAEAHNLLSEDEALRIQSVISQAGLPVRVQDLNGVAFDGTDVMRVMGQDKKNTHADAGCTLILPERIGAVRIEKGVPWAHISAFLTREHHGN